jgi:hypothetical protein
VAKMFVLENCLHCPHLIRHQHYTGDSFEIVFAWTCKNRPQPEFIGYEEDRQFPEIPKFCPLPTIQ